MYTHGVNRQKDLLSIGAFANMTRLSIKALRLYDQLDLLQPHHIDSQSGYRYYDVDQLSSARMIRSMREMDMPLVTIRQVLAAFAVSPAEAELLVYKYLETREIRLSRFASRFINLSNGYNRRKTP